MSMKFMEAKQKRQEITIAIDAILDTAGNENRALSDHDQKMLVKHRADRKTVDQYLAGVDADNSLIKQIGKHGHAALIDGGVRGLSDGPRVLTPESTIIQATAFRHKFASWMDNTVRAIGGGEMMATAPSGPVTFDGASGTEGAGILVPQEVPRATLAGHALAC